VKLLIAEDSQTLLFMLQAITSKWGFDPILADNGQHALDIANGKDPPQLLLLDWEMPKLDGLTLCKQLRQNDNDIHPYIILLTNRNEVSDLVSGLDAGANDYISKPFNHTELKARLGVGKRMLSLQTESMRARNELAYQATHDVLTGMLNRRAILDTMNSEIARIKRERNTLFVGLCDIDYFKKINDTFGHLTGDMILQEVGRRFSSTLRPYDRIGRYGGEEFLILASTTPHHAMSLFERLRQSIEEKPFVYEQEEISVTMSFGVISFSADDTTRDATSLLTEADKSLYEAKRAGRNQIIFSNPE
jgi:diguanylate cyclase (GGDEF)-like protein